MNWCVLMYNHIECSCLLQLKFSLLLHFSSRIPTYFLFADGINVFLLWSSFGCRKIRNDVLKTKTYGVIYSALKLIRITKLSSFQILARLHHFILFTPLTVYLNCQLITTVRLWACPGVVINESLKWKEHVFHKFL